ncbi:RHS repeat domain-containing protein [Pseudoalteromonas sp. MSK9-3]|uniref:RHS repeat domain-containing protein n=1 Tax=Pseudoalteromonas sp. MSK9-3 TaxID=1897633 RepID=UPI0016023262|nr:RHS repeat-associated core domain-containing protein [Pseudoalteromonas sp. MSK9-3]
MVFEWGTLVIPFIQTQYTHYDALGRVYLSQLSDNYAVGYKYNARGFKISEHGLRYNNDTMKVDETLLKTGNSVNFRGQVTKETYLGNQVLTYGYDSYTGLSDSLGAVGMRTESGQNSLSASYQYNAFGQLNKREFTGLYDQTRAETFTYDGLNRLRTATNRYGTLSNTLNYCYDALGNMLKKGSTSTCGAGSNDFSYGSSTRSTGNAGPHALLKDLRTGTSRTFNYDNNGNVTSDSDRSFVYSGFDKVTQIHQAGNMQVNFAYDANMRRYYRKDAYSTQNEDAGKVDTETIYLGAFEHITKGGPSGGSIIHQYTVGNMQISENLATGDITQKLMIRDHLGSVLAVSEVNAAKTAASITQTFRYDPFDQQYALQANSFSAFTGYMRQGFTGHEILNGLNVIHMNGRIYDPTIGRFLQADPFIQAPNNSQSYNRYSYVLNNPLSYTDPSGYFFEKLLGGLLGTKILRELAKVPVLNSLVQIGIGIGCGSFAAACMAAYSGLQTYAVTGSLGAGIRAAAISYATATAFNAVGGKFTKAGGFFDAGVKNGFYHISSHALVGGVSSTLQGGKFGHGFFSAGITKGLTPNFEGIGGFDVSGYNPAEAAIAGLLGGTISHVTGGKFANGAITAAMGNLFNNQNQRNKIKEHARAVRDHISALDFKDIGGRAKIAGWAIRGGFAKGDGSYILRSEVRAKIVQLNMVKALEVDVFNEMLPYAQSIANGGMTLTGDPKGTVAQAVGVFVPDIAVVAQFRGAMGLWGAAAAANEYYDHSANFKMTINKLDSRSLSYFANNCGATLRC